MWNNFLDHDYCSVTHTLNEGKYISSLFVTIIWMSFQHGLIFFLLLSTNIVYCRFPIEISVPTMFCWLLFHLLASVSPGMGDSDWHQNCAGQNEHIRRRGVCWSTSLEILFLRHLRSRCWSKVMHYSSSFFSVLL